MANDNNASEIARQVKLYQQAVQQEFETGNPTIDDSTEDVHRKVRRLFIDCMPAVAIRVRHIIEFGESENAQLKACKFAYEVVCQDHNNGPIDPLTEMLRKLQENDPIEKAVDGTLKISPQGKGG